MNLDLGVEGPFVVIAKSDVPGELLAGYYACDGTLISLHAIERDGKNHDAKVVKHLLRMMRE